MELCIMCDPNNKSSSAWIPGEDKDDEKHNDNNHHHLIRSNSLILFSKYFNLAPEELDFLKRQLRQDFLFCSRCEPILTDLSRLQSQLTSTQNEISRTLAHITSTIANVVDNSSQVIEEPKLVAINNVRKTICANYTPRGIVQDDFIHMESSDPRCKLALWGPELDSNPNEPLNSSGQENKIFNIKSEIETDEEEEVGEKYDPHFNSDSDEHQNYEQEDDDSDDIYIKEEPPSPSSNFQTSDLPLEVELTLKEETSESENEKVTQSTKTNINIGASISTPHNVSSKNKSSLKRPRESSYHNQIPGKLPTSAASSTSDNIPEERRSVEKRRKGEIVSATVTKKSARPKSNQGDDEDKAQVSTSSDSDDDYYGDNQQQNQNKEQNDKLVVQNLVKGIGPPIFEESPGVFRIRDSEFRFYQIPDNVHGGYYSNYYTCGECNLKVKRQDSAVKHYRRAHDTTCLKCQKCLRPYINQETLEKHNCRPKKYIGHYRRRKITDLGNGSFLMDDKYPFKIVEPEPETGHSFKCGTCQLMFLDEAAVVTHIRTKHMEPRYVCETCGRGFTRQWSLEKHQSTHQDFRSFMCEDCGMAFKTQPQLNKHRKCTHRVGVSPDDLKCPFPGCGREFTSFVSLSRHRIATGHRVQAKRVDTKCPRCNMKRVFKTEKNLKKHMETCKGPIVFPCGQCETLFKTKSGMVSHMELVHGVIIPCTTKRGSTWPKRRDQNPNNDVDMNNQNSNSSENTSNNSVRSVNLDLDPNFSLNMNETTTTASASVTTNTTTSYQHQ